LAHARLSVVIPVYNQASEIIGTLDALAVAVEGSTFDADVVVVDDGSTDGTGDAVEARTWPIPVRVVRQPNAGRFSARLAGIRGSAGEWCLLIDSRVVIDPDSLSFIERELDVDPAKRIWNAHVDIPVDGNPYAAFWDVITRRAFSAYFHDPQTTSFGLDEFERFPKGTTCFFAPRAALLEAFDAYRSHYDDPRFGNDDTPVIRELAAGERIHISPRFRCEYAARSTFRSFVRHAFHRGTVFVDGHGRRESRWFWIVAAFFPATLAWLYGVRRVPAVAVAPIVLASVGGAGLAVAERRPRQVWALALVTPVYAVAHAAGMWRGLLLAIRSGARRR